MKKLAAMLAGLLILVCAVPAWAFTDIANLSGTEQAALAVLSERGVIEGYPDGSFRPDESISRAELAKVLCLYAGEDELQASEPAFSDVAPADWFYGWVNRAAAMGWSTGYADGCFLPQETVTQQETAAMILRLAKVDTANFSWPDDYIQAALGRGLLADFAFDASAPASRLQVCLMLNNLSAVEEEQEPQASLAAPADGLYFGLVESAAGREFKLSQLEASLPLAYNYLRLPQENTIIYCVVQGGAVESWSLLLSPVNGGVIASTTAITRQFSPEVPFSWVNTRSGVTTAAPPDLSSAQPLVRFCSYRNIAVGSRDAESRNYWLGDPCQIYEVREGKIYPANRDSIEIGQAVTLLVNKDDEAVLLLCWK